jgi:hypothetical protein
VLNGAQDGIEFFNSTQGSLDVLKNSFKWEWLRRYFENKYGSLE